MKTKWKVVRSVSKDAWNVVSTELGGKYKIARVPYLITDDYLTSVANMAEAEDHAILISKAPEMREMLEQSMFMLGNLGEFEVAKEIKELVESTKL